MARRRHQSKPGEDEFLPLTDVERRAHAEALSRAHQGHQCAEHADSLCEAAEYYAILREHGVAEELFREALTVEEAEPGKPQAAYAAFLLDRGRHEEALVLIAEARRLRPQDSEVFVTIGEALEGHNYHQQAARWFTAGLVEQLGALADLTIDDLGEHFDLALLANGRYRVRQALDLPPDHIDGLVEELRAPAA